MRKRNFKLIRKTLEWRHRRKGTDTMLLPQNVPLENFRYFKIFGSDAKNFAAGVGDYDEELSSYVIPFHVHGKNLMGGEEFMAVHSALNISKIAPAIVSGCYSTTPMPEHNGTVVIGPKHVKFKEKTAYTLALHLKYFTSSSKRSIGLRFEYSDGTYDAPIINSTSREFRLCFTSDPAKNLVAIASSNETAYNVRYGIEGFGFFEGAYSEYDEIFEPYIGARGYVTTDRPLLKIDTSADEIDVVNGRSVRKIQKIRIESTCELSATDDECVFKIPLPTPMRQDRRFISPFSPLSNDAEVGLSVNESADALLFKASSDIRSEEDMTEYLLSNPFEVFYVMREYEYQSAATIYIMQFDKELPLEIFTTEAPSKIIAEYI